jgi:hypothetical protein
MRVLASFSIASYPQPPEGHGELAALTFRHGPMPLHEPLIEPLVQRAFDLTLWQ